MANGEIKENEIVAAPKLLLQIGKYVAGSVIVGDAMQCQRKLSVQIRGAGGDWIWFVKGNQPDGLDNIKVLFENEPLAVGHSPSRVPPGCDFKTARRVEKAHGRLEERVITVSSMLDEEYLKWPGVAQVFKLESWIKGGEGETKHQVRYGLTSLPAEIADAALVMAIARAEWGIENQLHYRRDVRLREDWSQLRPGQSQQVNSILNHTVVGLMGLAGVSNIQATGREMSYAPAQAIKLLTQPLLSSN